jgi:hypothetical protein
MLRSNLCAVALCNFHRIDDAAWLSFPVNYCAGVLSIMPVAESIRHEVQADMQCKASAGCAVQQACKCKAFVDYALQQTCSARL